MDPSKKISFSFSKSAKLPNIFAPKPKESNEVELIDCLEGHSIKIKNAVEEIKTPLIIPLRDDAKDLLDRVRQSRQIKSNKEEVKQKQDSELTLDELAARELIEETTKKHTEDTPKTKVHVLAVAVDKSIPENDNEPTVDDYENVPISDYGFAMLRGMGWTECSGIGKQNKQVTKTVEPELRPKGMGLGANKVVNVKKLSPVVDENGKELNLVKGAFAKISAGKHNGNYCEVLGLDDEAGRIIVKTTIKQLTLSLNEFMVVPVTKQEYIKNSKIINNATYEEYKKRIGSNVDKVKSISSKADDKPSNSKHKVSSSSDVSQTSRDKNKETSSTEDRYSRKRRERSESPYPAKSRRRSRSPSRRHTKKSKHRRASKSPEDYASRKHRSAKNSDSSDVDEYKEKKFNGSKSREETKRLKKKKKKSKKHKKYREDSYSSDEEYRKKKKRKSKKYSSDDSSGSSSTSEVDKFGRSRNKHRLSKNHR